LVINTLTLHDALPILYTDLIHTYIGKTADRFYDHVMPESNFVEGAMFVKNHFFIVYPPKDFTLEVIEKHFLYLIRKKGIRGCIRSEEHTSELQSRENL